MLATVLRKSRPYRFVAIATSIESGLVACLVAASAQGQTLEACKGVPKATPKAPYTMACSGKSECAASDTLTVTASSTETTVIEVMCLDFGNGGLVWLPTYLLDKPPQPPLSYPLAPLFTAAIAADAVDSQSDAAKLRAIFQRAVGAKLTADVVVIDKSGKAFRQPLTFDVASLWSSRQLTPGGITVECNPCYLDSVLKLSAPGLAAWRQSTGLDMAKVQLVLSGTRLPGLTPRFGSGKEADSVTFKLQRLRDKPDNVAAWNELLKGSLAREPRAATVALADDRGEVAASPVVSLDVMPFGYRLCLACVVLFLLLVGLGFFGKTSKWAWFRDDFEVPAGVIGPEGRKFSLGKVQMAAWSVAIIVGFVLVGLAMQTVWVLNEINDTLVILLGISATTAAGAMALVPDQVNRQIELLKTALPADKVAIEAKLRTLLTSSGPLKDILSDVGSDSPSLHRLQNLAFTVVLILMFLFGALTTGSFPNFTGTLLALMGVSGGAYLGFKAAAK
jgi:hypothetical protein